MSQVKLPVGLESRARSPIDPQECLGPGGEIERKEEAWTYDGRVTVIEKAFVIETTNFLLNRCGHVQKNVRKIPRKGRSYTLYISRNS